MIQVSINYFSVVAAAAASMALGAAWYGPLFANRWVRLTGITPDQIASAKSKGMARSYALAALGSLAMAYVLAVFIHGLTFSAYLTTERLMAGLAVSFWSWLGFVAPVTLGVVLWEGKPWQLWLLNNGYYFLALLAMGAILGVWG